MDNIFDYEKEMNSVENAYKIYRNKDYCICKQYSGMQILGNIPESHDVNDVVMVKKCLDDHFSRVISKAKWCLDRSKVYNILNEKFFEGMKETFYDFHEKNKHNNIELNKWNSTL